MKKLITIISLMLLTALPAWAQQQPEYGTENHLSFGYTTQTGNFGPNGFEVGLDYRLREFLAIAGEGSFLFTGDTVNNVRTNLSPTGFVNMRVSTNAQNFQAGPRFFFPRALRQPKLVPFAHLLFGVSRASTDFELTEEDDQIGSSSDTNWSWSLGGGVDYWVNKKWAVRAKVDLLKTHLQSDSQTNARIMVGMSYNFDFKK